MGKQILHYHLCPRCYRATPASLGEVYCPNDGTKLLTACPNCDSSITSPHNRFCVRCGHKFEHYPTTLKTHFDNHTTRIRRRKL